jgi:hypothetical protein
MVVIIFLFGENGIGQTSITGKISDKNTGEDMIFANIIISQKGAFIKGATTDIDGNYSIQVDSGKYDMEISYTGYPTQKITGIVVNEGQATKVVVLLSTDLKLQMLNIVVMNICIPIIRQDENPNKLEITSEKIKILPTRNINEIITITPGVSFTQ